MSKVDLKKAMEFFVALAGSNKKTAEILESLKKNQIFKNIDMSDMFEKSGRKVEEVASSIKDKATKNFIYRELFRIAYLDRKITNKEREGLEKVRRLLNISKQKVKSLESWVKKFFKVVSEGDKIIK